MSEDQAPYEVVPHDIGELEDLPTLDFKDNSLCFYGDLTEELIDKIKNGLKKFTEGHQFYWGDFWIRLENDGIDFTQYIPDSVPEGTAGNWYMVCKRFSPEDRTYDHKIIKFSHYAAARTLELELHEAHRILKAAEEGQWPHNAVSKAVRISLGKPERQLKPKIIFCKHCDKPFADIEEGCPWCAGGVLQGRVDELRDGFTELSALFPNPDPNVMQAIIGRALEV